MTKKQKRTLILASIIGTLFACYEEDEKTKLHDELHARIGKGIHKQVQMFGVECVKKVAHDEGNTIWGSAADHFTDMKITIEASSCILALVGLDEKALSKQYGLGAGKLAKWAKPSRRSDAVSLEKSSRDVASYVFNAVSAFYGIEVEEKMSVMARIQKSMSVA